jgi:hypothetical protein
MIVVMNHNGKEYDFTSLINKQMRGEITRKDVEKEIYNIKNNKKNTLQIKIKSDNNSVNKNK